MKKEIKVRQTKGKSDRKRERKICRRWNRRWRGKRIIRRGDICKTMINSIFKTVNKNDIL